LAKRHFGSATFASAQKHHTAYAGSGSTIGEGSLVCWGVLIGPHVVVGQHTVIGRGSIVSHDTKIGDFCTIGTSVTFGGQCVVADGVTVEDYAVVKPRTFIGAGARVCAESAVIKDVPAHAVVGGIPALDLSIKPPQDHHETTTLLVSHLRSELCEMQRSRHAVMRSHNALTPWNVAKGSRVALLGAGGYCAVLVEDIRECGFEIEGIYDDSPSSLGKCLLGVFVKGAIADAPLHTPLVLAIGQNEARRAITTKHASRKWATIVHPTAYVAPDAVIGEGCTIERYCVIGPGAKVGRFCLFGARAIIGAGSTIEDYAFVAAASVIGNGAAVRTAAVVGLSSVILPKVEIGSGSTILMASVVVRDAPPNVSLSGVPARPIGTLQKTRLG